MCCIWRNVDQVARADGLRLTAHGPLHPAFENEEGFRVIRVRVRYALHTGLEHLIDIAIPPVGLVGGEHDAGAVGQSVLLWAS